MSSPQTKAHYKKPIEKPSVEYSTPERTPTGNFDPETLTQAVLHAQDILNRVQIPFIVLGNIAYQMRNNLPLEDHRVVFGVMERHMAKECTSLLPIVEPTIELLTDGYRIHYEKVPVYIKVLTKDYPTLLFPDIVFYSIETFRIPNPFEVYWSGNHLDI